MIDPKHKLHMASGRLETLGDGLFAIVMTILILELKIPDMEGHGMEGFRHALHETWRDFLCYVISFVVLGIMWFGHRMMFEYITRTDRYFIFLGIIFYMVVCLVPITTKFLAKNTWTWYAITVYAINLTLCNLTLYGQWLYGLRKKYLMTRELPEEVRKEARLLFLLSPGVYAVAIGFSFFFPVVSILIFIATPIVYLLPNKLDNYMK